MRIDPTELGAERIYRLMTGIVVPRPIAWVTSLSNKGVLNLAPFSAFTFVSQKPPMLAISVGRKGADYKDTAHNILDTEEYVIHIADTPLMQALHDSSVEHPRRSARSSISDWRPSRASASRCRALPPRPWRWNAASGNASNSATPRAGSSSARS